MKSSFKKLVRSIVCVLMAVLFATIGSLNSFAAVYTKSADPDAEFLYKLSKDTIIKSKDPIIYTQSLTSKSQANVIKFSISSNVFTSSYPDPTARGYSIPQGAYYCIRTIDNPNNRLVAQGRASYDTKGSVYTVKKSGIINKKYTRTTIAESDNDGQNYQIVVKLNENTDYYISTSVDGGTKAYYQLNIEPNVDKNYDYSMGGRWEATDYYIENGTFVAYINSITYLNKEQTAQLYNVLCAMNDYGAISLEAKSEGTFGILQELVETSSLGWAFVSTFVPLAKLASLGITAADLALSAHLSEVEQKDLFNKIENDTIKAMLIRLGELTMSDIQKMMYEVKNAGECEQKVGYQTQYFTAKKGIAITERYSLLSKEHGYTYSSYNATVLEGAKFAIGRWVS